LVAIGFELRGSSEDLIEQALTRPGGTMKPSTKNQIIEKFHELKGKAKGKAGQVTNNPSLAAEGQDEELVGKVQEKVGQIKKVFEN